MMIKGLILLTVVAMVIGKPAAKPISVYQQEDAEDRQYQQPQQFRPAQIQYNQPPQQPKHRPAFQQPQGALQQGQPGQQLSEDYEMEPPQPYQFSFDVNDDENTNYQNRKEQREGNKISGSYSVVDSDGFIRTVTYTADPVEGFKATVSREPTNIVVKLPEHKPQEEPLGPKFQYNQPAAKQTGIQYTGAPNQQQRPVQLRPQPVQANLRKQQTQQYLQSPDQYSAYPSDSQGGQINQFLSDASQLSQISNANAALRG